MPVDLPGSTRRWLPLSRRQFLAGAAATTFLVACGDDDTTTATGGPTSSGDDGPPTDDVLSVVRFFGPYFAAGVTARVPFGLSDSDGLLPVPDSPAEFIVTVKDPDGTVVADAITATLHAEGLPRPYYAFSFVPEAAGFYDYSFDTDAGEVISQFQVVAADDPSVADFVGPGQAMPAVPTPTVDDAMGVTPICTREPACDLHAASYADVVGTGPSVLLVSTPAFCQVAVCGPILDILLDQIGAYPGVTFVHAEVYTNPAENQEDFAPVIGALGLPFEPVLYTVDTDGVVVERLDYIFDGAEIRSALDRLVG